MVYKLAELIKAMLNARFVTSFEGMSVPTTVVGMLVLLVLPKKIVGMLYVIFSTKYKNVTTLQSFYEWFPQLF